MTQCSFGRDQAHDALNQFLAGDTMVRSIHERTSSEGYGEGPVLAEIISAEYYERLRDKAAAFDDQTEKAPRGGGQRTAYEPYVLAPGATVERMLPTDYLHDPLARTMYGKKYADLAEAERRKVDGIAIVAVIHVQLDADSHGVVPVLRWEANGELQQLTWQFARKTNTPGLYIREAFGLLDECQIVTGSGWLIPLPFYNVETAEEFAKRLADELPGIDWFTVDKPHITADVMARVLALYKEHGRFGSQPEPVTA